MEDTPLVEIVNPLNDICDDFEFKLLVWESVLCEIIFQRKMDVFINHINGIIALTGFDKFDKGRVANFFQDFEFFFQRFLDHRIFLKKGNTQTLDINFFFVLNAHPHKVTSCIRLQNLLDGFVERD